MPPTTSFASTTATKPSARSIHQGKMSAMQTSLIAHQVRQKLAKEANCPDYSLHRVVCHANMLDTLITDLAHAEDEQKGHLDKAPSGVQKPTRKSKTEKWVQVVLETGEEEESESSDELELSSDDDSSDGEFEHREDRASEKASDIVVSSGGQDGAGELHEDLARLALERTTSRHHHHSQSSEHAQSANKLQ